jgi:cysteine desulfurase
MEIYLDNAATTWVYPEVAETVRNIMCSDYGNPSSMHKKGAEAERIIKDSVRSLASVLKVKEKEIFFTSGGTESNNWALIGAARAGRRRGRRIVTSKIEHASVSAPLKYLEEQGYEIISVGTDKNGIIRLDELEEAVNGETVLVSVMLVNNEIGSVQPVSEISRIIKQKNPDVIFHSDAVQAFGKVKINPKQLGIDLLSASGHKIHAPKGTGFLYVSEKTRLSPLIYGGGQQNGMRSGTDNVPGIAALAQAAKIIYSSLDENAEKMYALRNRLAEGISSIEDTVVNSPENSFAAPHIVNASFIGIRSEVMLHTLEEHGIYVSSGSACSVHKKSVSPTLSAIGCGAARIDSAIRFSFCEATTQDDIDKTMEVLKDAVPVLRRYTRR